MHPIKTAITYFIFVLALLSQQVSLSQNWEEQAVGVLPLNYGVFDIAVVDENVVWAVAFDQSITSSIPFTHTPRVIKTTDGGDTWEIYNIEVAQGRISLDIEAFDAEVAFITTQDYGNGSGKGVFKTEDGGDTWIQKLNSITAGVWIRFFNEQEGIVINRHAMATTKDGGESWQLVNSNNIPAFLNNEATLLYSGNNSCHTVGNQIWFGTNRGRIYRSKNKGQTWEVVNTSLGNNAIISSVAFQDSLNGLAMNTSSFFTSFAETTDGGDSWNNITSSPSVAISNIAYVPGTEGVFIGTSSDFVSNSSRVSVYSTDFGRNWSVINTNIGYGGSQFISPGKGWASKNRVSFASQPAMYKWDNNLFVTSTETESLQNIAVYPNPFRDHISISGFDGFRGYRLFSGDGQLIQSESIGPHSKSLQFQHLELGMYFLQIISDQDRIVTKKIFKVN